MFASVRLWTEEKQQKSCILAVKTSGSISEDVFFCKLGKHILNKITVCGSYVSMVHSQNQSR